MSKPNKTFWHHGRRERLLKDILRKIPEYPRPTTEWRDFQEEAMKLLPELNREIKKHNSKVNKERDRMARRNATLRRELTAKIRYGDETICEQVVAQYMNPDMGLEETK